MSDTSDFDFASSELAFNVNSYGKTISVKKKSSGTYSPSTGSSTVTSTTYTTKGIVLGYRDYNVDGTLVMRGDRRVILATGCTWSPSFYMPVSGDIISSGSTSWNVVDVREIELQGEKIGYVVQVRGMKRG